jgi:acyl-coenzyme A thioesterase PaaI-like protein
MRRDFDARRQRGRGGGALEEWEEIAARMEAFRLKREEMARTLLSDVQSLLTEEQAARWPAVERTRRRERSVREGFSLISGERVDLMHLVQEAVPEEGRAEVAELLARYEEDMDRELIQRNRLLEENWRRFGDLRRTGEFAGMEELWESSRQAAARVRDVNRRYARQIGSVLAPDAAGSLDVAFRRESFPQVYRATHASAVLSAAAGLGDLNAEQREAVEALRASYSRDEGSINDRLAKAVEEREATGGPMRMWGWGDEEGPMRDLRAEKRALVDSTVAALERFLTEEQRARLPAREEERGPGQRLFIRERGGRGPT